MGKAVFFYIMAFLLGVCPSDGSLAQTPPSESEYGQHEPFFEAVFQGELETVDRFIRQGIDVERTDKAGRTAILIAAFRSNEAVFKRLVEAGGNVNAFDNNRYDAVTIAAVANDLEMLRLALTFGGNPKNVTSPFQGTALIAAAHLGHVEAVRMLLDASSNVDHVNNLGWTALLETVILGDGGPRHVLIAKDLLAHGANKYIADDQGLTPLAHARQRGYTELVSILQ